MDNADIVRVRVANALPAPTAPAALPNIPGGAPNLMPIKALADPVRLEFTLWQHSRPTPTEPESVEIFCEGVKVGDRRWTQPLPESERFVEITPDCFSEGTLQFHYVGHVYNASELRSDDLTLTVDKTPPVLGANNGRLQFPELGDSDLTEDFLLTHGNRLLALMPDYQGAAPGDVIIYYWDSEPFENNEVDRWVLTREDLAKPLEFAYTGDVIVDRGDGMRYAQYLIEDRAGNASQVATPSVLEVAAQPAPRVLPALEVPLLGQSAELELRKLNAALDVSIPQAAVIKPGEAFELLWGDEECFGAWREEGVPGKNDYAVPLRNVVAMASKQAQLYYRVLVGDEPLPSDTRSVKVTPTPTANMPTPQLGGRSGGNLDVGGLTSDPLVTLGTWLHISVDQRVSLQAEGLSRNGQVLHPILVNYKLSETDVAEGIGSGVPVPIPLSYLRQLVPGSQLEVTAKLSYDNGTTWPLLPNFGRLWMNIL